VLDGRQIAFLTAALKRVKSDKFTGGVIIAVHHPPYSIDAHHGSSPTIAAAIDKAAATAKRTPDMVLSGHVHDYQRFTRTTGAGPAITYVVSGNGGYHNLHKLAPGARTLSGCRISRAPRARAVFGPSTLLITREPGRRRGL